MYYSWIDGKYERAQSGREQNIITVPDDYEARNKGIGVAVETNAGNRGEYDIEQDEELLSFVAENLPYFEEMEEEEAQERISLLSEEWGLNAEELQYLL